MQYVKGKITKKIEEKKLKNLNTFKWGPVSQSIGIFLKSFISKNLRFETIHHDRCKVKRISMSGNSITRPTVREVPGLGTFKISNLRNCKHTFDRPSLQRWQSLKTCHGYHCKLSIAIFVWRLTWKSQCCSK